MLGIFSFQRRRKITQLQFHQPLGLPIAAAGGFIFNQGDGCFLELGAFGVFPPALLFIICIPDKFGFFQHPGCFGFPGCFQEFRKLQFFISFLL